MLLFFRTGSGTAGLKKEVKARPAAIRSSRDELCVDLRHHWPNVDLLKSSKALYHVAQVSTGDKMLSSWAKEIASPSLFAQATTSLLNMPNLNAGKSRTEAEQSTSGPIVASVTSQNGITHTSVLLLTTRWSVNIAPTRSSSERWSEDDSRSFSSSKPASRQGNSARKARTDFRSDAMRD